MTADVITIRRATAADHETVVQGVLTMARDSEGIELPVDTVNRGVKAVFNDPGKGFYILAEDTADGNTFAGCLQVTYEWSDWTARQYWWIQSVHVEEKYRRRGVFRKMFEYVVAEAKNADAASVRLYVEKENERARQVYEKVGIAQSHYNMHELQIVKPGSS
eukprot:Clim_evm30s235 gene=Clim_evmTU30s235